MIDSRCKEAIHSAHWIERGDSALEGLFFTDRTLIGYKGEGQSRNDECSKPTAVSVKTDGRTERGSLFFM